MARLAGLIIVALGGTAHADELASSPIRAGYEPTGRLLDFAARRALDVEQGIDPMLTYIVETFAAPGLDRAVVTAGLLMLELDVALSKLVGPGWGALHAAGVAIHGRGLSAELMDVHGVSGNVAAPDVRLFEAWAEQPIGPLTIRAGILAVDQELVLAEHASTLIAATFGITAQFSANIVNPTYPVGAPGVSARLEHGAVTARAAAYDSDGDALGVAELALGPVAVGAWHHDARGTGAYATADARFSTHVGAFARAGYSPDAPVVTYLDAGLRATPGRLRPDDLVSVGMAFATTDDGAQIILEATYELQVRWLTLQPDLQLLLLRERSVGVVGLRTTVVF